MTKRRKCLLSMLGAVAVISVFAFFNIGDSPNPAINGPGKSDSVNQNPSSNRTRTILMWTTVFGEKRGTLEDCPLKNQCQVTFDKALFPDADAVVFHPQDVKVAQLPPHPSSTRQKFVLWSMETAQNIEDILKPLPKNFFHWTMTHLSASHAHSPYGGYWVPPKVAAEKGFSAERLPSTEDEIFRDKTTKGIFWLVSNCKTPSGRERAVEALSKYIPVDMAGGCAKNETMKNVCPKGSTCEEQFRKYYFFIAAENSICTDYITEKYWSRYHLPLIPIVMRKNVYQRRVPPMSYIAMDDFPNAKALADHLNTLMNNRSEYMKYFAWRGEGWARARWNAPGYRIGFCRLCEKLLETTADHPTAPIADIARWYTEQSNCENDDFAKSWAS